MGATLARAIASLRIICVLVIQEFAELMNFIHAQIENAHIISWEVNLSFEQLDS